MLNTATAPGRNLPYPARPVQGRNLSMATQMCGCEGIPCRENRQGDSCGTCERPCHGYIDEDAENAIQETRRLIADLKAKPWSVTGTPSIRDTSLPSLRSTNWAPPSVDDPSGLTGSLGWGDEDEEPWESHPLEWTVDSAGQRRIACWRHGDPVSECARCETERALPGTIFYNPSRSYTRRKTRQISNVFNEAITPARLPDVTMTHVTHCATCKERIPKGHLAARIELAYVHRTDSCIEGYTPKVKELI